AIEIIEEEEEKEVVEAKTTASLHGHGLPPIENEAYDSVGVGDGANLPPLKFDRKPEELIGRHVQRWPPHVVRKRPLHVQRWLRLCDPELPIEATEHLII
ncbi:hypothetical protein U1Q18_019253, partial [Sarracenia purpurea var. burkii]